MFDTPKTWATMSKVRKAVKKSGLEHLAYNFALIRSGYTAEFDCEEDMIKQVHQKGFMVKGKEYLV